MTCNEAEAKTWAKSACDHSVHTEASGRAIARHCPRRRVMNQQEIAERSIVDRYVLGQLSERELLEFEEYYFDHPEVLKEIALAEVMRDGLRSTQQPQAAQSLASWSQRLLAHLTTPAWSLGATAAAVVLAGVLTVQTIQGPLVAGSHTQGSGSVLPVVADVSLVRMRGAQGAPPVVQIKA